MAFPLQSVAWQHSSERIPINGQKLLRMADGSTRIHKSHIVQPYRFRVIWDYLTLVQADSAYSHFESNKTTADTLTWDDSVGYSVKYVKTPKKTPSQGKTTTDTLWRFEMEVVGRAA